MKKQAFTLLEILIAFGLLAFMMTTLFFWHQFVLNEKKTLTKCRLPMQEERYLQQYLTRVFKTASLKPKDQDEICAFYSHNNAIVFTFDNGSHKDPLLSNHVLGKICFNPTSRSLLLGVWPAPKKNTTLRKSPSYTCTLLEDVDFVEFLFYHPPNHFDLISPDEINQIKPTVGWQALWRQEYHQLPMFVKISCSHHQTKLPTEFCFEIPKTIVYTKDVGDV